MFAREPKRHAITFDSLCPGVQLVAQRHARKHAMGRPQVRCRLDTRLGAMMMEQNDEWAPEPLKIQDTCTRTRGIELPDA